jgi:hypothetical protein
VNAPGHGTGSDQAWLHELRNTVNSSCIALEVVKRAIDDGDTERARKFVGYAEESCGRSRDLLISAARPRGTTQSD